MASVTFRDIQISEKERNLLRHLSNYLKAVDLGQISAETRTLPSQAMKVLESLSNKGLVVISRNNSDAISGILVKATPNALRVNSGKLAHKLNTD